MKSIIMMATAGLFWLFMYFPLDRSNEESSLVFLAILVGHLLSRADTTERKLRDYERWRNRVTFDEPEEKSE